jgi:hypothetical protein
MNTNKVFKAMAACACALVSLAQAAPTQLSSDAGEVRDIRLVTGSGPTATLFAATQGGGVFKSINGGATWSATALNKGYAWKIAVSPLTSARAYVATDSGVFKTTDTGATWTQITFDPARAVAVDPGSVTNDTLLVGVPGQGIIRSADSGATFTRQSGGLDSTDVRDIVYQASAKAYALLECDSADTVGTAFQGNWGGVFLATNANAASTIAWSSFNMGSLPSKCVRAITANTTTVFAGIQNPLDGSGGIYRSTGAAWTAPGPGNPNAGDIFGVESLRASGSNIVAGSRAVGVWTSNDGGVSY